MSPLSNTDGLDAANVHSFPNNHANDIRLDLLALRTSVTLAWQERGVMLSPDEQKELQGEIAELCQYLKDLTGCRD
jgi:hypothetical protein